MTRQGMYKLNSFMQISLGPIFLCDLLIENEQYELPHASYISFLAQVEGKLSLDELVKLAAETIDQDQAGQIVEDLIKNRILVVEEDNPPEMEGARHWIKRGWMEALVLHLKTRNLSFSDTAGGKEADARMLMGGILGPETNVEIWKTFKGKTAVSLPPPESLPEKPVEEVLLYRRSNRPWRFQSMSMERFSSLLYHANIETRRIRTELEEGIREDPELLLNSSFTALETYCVVMAVDGLASGLYHYDPKDHKVTLVREGLFRDEIVKCCIGQSRPYGASCVFLITAVWERFMFRYRHPRAYRTLLTNVAELGHKYLLLGTSMKLSTFMTPAFNDRYVDEFMGLDPHQEGTLYAIGLG